MYTSTFQGFALNGCEKRSAVFDSPCQKTGLRVFPWHPFGRSKSHARSRKSAKIPKAKVLDFLFGEEITEEQRRYRFCVGKKPWDLCKGWVNHHFSNQNLDGDYPWVLGFFIFVPMGKSPFF